jgi:hypothetical protein
VGVNSGALEIPEHGFTEFAEQGRSRTLAFERPIDSFPLKKVRHRLVGRLSHSREVKKPQPPGGGRGENPPER